MTLFASDLDQTLIYSKKFIIDPIGSKAHPVRLIETKDDEEISYMTEKAISQLKKLTKQLCFIPVTTRTIEQYKRITIFQNEIKTEYAIVSNGGNILVDRQVDKGWSRLIRKRLDCECLSHDLILKEFNKIANDSWVISQRMADELFSYYIIDKSSIPIDEINSFARWAKKKGWNMSIQGRKLYLVPDCINKWAAISYIKEITCSQNVIAAGDSLLDLCILQSADFSIAPNHGELSKSAATNTGAYSKICFTKSSGIVASEEILESISKYNCKFSKTP